MYLLFLRCSAWARGEGGFCGLEGCDESGVEALCCGCVVVLEGVAGDEGAKGAALDGPFGLETGGEGVVVGASVERRLWVRSRRKSPRSVGGLCRCRCW